MSRHKRATVDYFPHVVNHKETMFILEQKYGNDGYAFWFKLLERLGATEGHILDCRNEATWRFLQAVTRLSADTCAEILDLLALLGAIDKDLWQHNRIVWCQKFVDGVADVYTNRRAALPLKPTCSFLNKRHNGDNYGEKEAAAGLSDVISTPDGGYTEKKPQSIVEESIVEERKVEETTPPDSSLTERAVLAVLKDIPNWPFDYAADLAHIRELVVDFPVIDLLEQVKKLRDWLKDKPLKEKGNPRLRFRNWCSKAAEWAKDKQPQEESRRVLRVYK